MLLCIIAAVFRQNELYVYIGFFIGFFIATMPIKIHTIHGSAIFAVIIPVIALYVPIPLSHSIPGLIRLGSIIAIWAMLLIGTSWIASLAHKKWIHGDARQASK